MILRPRLKPLLPVLLAAACLAGPVLAQEGGSAPFAVYQWSWGQHGSGVSQYRNPTDIAVFRNAIGVVNLVVVDTGNARLTVLTDQGAFQEKWGQPGAGPGQYSSPQGVAVDAKGTVFVADSGNHRIQKTNAWTNAMTDLSGNVLGEIGRAGKGEGELDFPTDAALDADGNLYIVDSGNARVQKVAQDGRFLAAWGSPGSGPGQFDLPLAVAVGPDGSVYVTDAKNNRVQRFDAAGRFVGEWGGAGDGPCEFFGPAGIAADKEGRVYVVDRGNHRVQVFDAAGKWLGVVGGEGKGKGQLLRPYGVAVDDEGQIFVVDTGNHRIQVYARR